MATKKATENPSRKNGKRRRRGRKRRILAQVLMCLLLVVLFTGSAAAGAVAAYYQAATQTIQTDTETALKDADVVEADLVYVTAGDRRVLLTDREELLKKGDEENGF